MRSTILKTALFPMALVAASCGLAQTPASTGPVDLGEGSPFSASAHGSFAEPWALAFEPGTGRIFITEKAGTIRFVDPASGAMGEVSGAPEVAYGGQGGLGDIAFSPDYATSRAVYLSWAQAADGAARRAVVGRGTLACAADGCHIEGLAVIWRQSLDVESFGHFSHKITFSPDGQHLLISSGERMQGMVAQDNTNNLGTIVRLNLDGTPVAGNPFATQGAPANQILSYGHRNLLGLAFDTDGQLWDLEHGPRGGDEINRIDAGANYGWPVRSNGDDYSGTPIPDHTPDDGFSQPAISWNPVIAPGDFLFYSGTMWPQWQGQALIASLGTRSIVRVDTDAASNSATELARYPFPQRLRDIAQAPDGALWVIEDGSNGRLLRLAPAQ